MKKVVYAFALSSLFAFASCDSPAEEREEAVEEMEDEAEEVVDEMEEDTTTVIE